MHAQARQHLRPSAAWSHTLLLLLLCALCICLRFEDAVIMPQILHARVHHEQPHCQVPEALHLAAGWNCDGRRRRRLNSWLLQSCNRKVSLDSSGQLCARSQRLCTYHTWATYLPNSIMYRCVHTYMYHKPFSLHSSSQNTLCLWSCI